MGNRINVFRGLTHQADGQSSGNVGAVVEHMWSWGLVCAVCPTGLALLSCCWQPFSPSIR